MGGSIVASALWPAALYTGLVLVIAALLLGLSHVLGERQRHGSQSVQYESGIKPAGPLPRRLSVEFYQVALFFVIFDLEAVFILAWAVAARQLGWPGYLEVLVFVLLLFAGLVYLWRVGALDWGAAGRRRRAAKAAARSTGRQASRRAGGGRISGAAEIGGAGGARLGGVTSAGDDRGGATMPGASGGGSPGHVGTPPDDAAGPAGAAR